MEQLALKYMLNLPDKAAEAAGRPPESISYLGEEICDWGLDPNAVSEEAFLKARNLFISGRIESEEVVPLALRYQAEYDRRDLALHEFLVWMDERAAANRATKPEQPPKRR